MTGRGTCRTALGLALLLLATACSALTPTEAPGLDPGLLIKGRVRLESQEGSGLPGVAVYRSYSAYSGQVVATTGADGAYQAPFAPIPGDEMVTVWPELEGYAFEPEQVAWRHHYGYEARMLDFVAVRVAARSVP